MQKLSASSRIELLKVFLWNILVKSCVSFLQTFFLNGFENLSMTEKLGQRGKKFSALSSLMAQLEWGDILWFNCCVFILSNITTDWIYWRWMFLWFTLPSDRWDRETGRQVHSTGSCSDKTCYSHHPPVPPPTSLHGFLKQ